MSDVAIVRGERSLDTVYNALDFISIEEAIQTWDQVLIKINLITSKTWDTGVTTDPIVVEALVERVKDLGKRVYVVETDAQMTDANKAVVDTGMMDMLDRVGVEFINMRHEDEQVKLPVTDGRKLKSIKVAKIATESAIISASKMKTLHGTQVTLGLKNMFGMLTTKWKFKYHRHGMHNVIFDVVRTLPPHVSVIDAFVALKTIGNRAPIQGIPVKLDTVIASTDPVAADAVGAMILGYNPPEVNHIRWLSESGMGEIEDIQIHGESIEFLKELFQKSTGIV